MLRLFYDTEFTNFQQSKLISIGITNEHLSKTRMNCYLEISDIDMTECSDFVIEEIIPKLSKLNDYVPYNEAQQKLWGWLDKIFEVEYNSINGVKLLSDYATDEQLISELLAGYPKLNKITLKNIYQDFSDSFHNPHSNSPKKMIAANTRAAESIEEGYNHYFLNNPHLQHHALEDAKALSYGWMFAMDKLLK